MHKLYSSHHTQISFSCTSHPSHCHTLTTHRTVTLTSHWHNKTSSQSQASPAAEPVETSAPGPSEEQEERLVDRVSVGGQLYATSQLQTNLYSSTLGEGEGKSEDSDVELDVYLLLVKL